MTSSFLAGGLGDVWIVTQGYTPGAPVPHYPLKPSVVTQGILGVAGAVLVQGYHLAASSIVVTIYPDPFAATSTTTVNPFAATSTSTVNPLAATSRQKGS